MRAGVRVSARRMNRFMRLPELAREEVAEGLTSVRSRIPRTCAGSHRPASREANPSSSRFIKTTPQDTPREKACLLTRSRGAGIAAEYQSPRGYMRVDCGERYFFAFPSRFGRRRSDRFAISFADNLRNLLAGSFPGRALRRRPGCGTPHRGSAMPTVHVRSCWPMLLWRCSAHVVL